MVRTFFVFVVLKCLDCSLAPPPPLLFVRCARDKFAYLTNFRWYTGVLVDLSHVEVTGIVACSYGLFYCIYELVLDIVLKVQVAIYRNIIPFFDILYIIELQGGVLTDLSHVEVTGIFAFSYNLFSFIYRVSAEYRKVFDT